MNTTVQCRTPQSRIQRKFIETELAHRIGPLDWHAANADTVHTVEEAWMSTAEIYNARRVSDRVVTGGHPTEQQLRDAALEGVQAVINLAPIDHRSVPNEAALVQSLGMRYHDIPVTWDAPTTADFAAFERALELLAGQHVLIHCAANFRVTAFYSLYARKHLGWTAAEAHALRRSIWDGSDYPIWQAFISSIEQTL